MKKKVTGQSIAIIVLAILLLFTIVFGGVFAYYNYTSNKVSGKIIMANLNIDFKNTSGTSGSSDIIISNNMNVVPNQLLGNTPLIVTNNSNTPIYIAVFYTVEAYKIIDNEKTNLIEYDKSKPTLLGADNAVWSDQLYTSNESEKPVKLRCLVTRKPIQADVNEIVVISENSLKLSKDVGNEFQATNLCFSFRACAIASNSLDVSITDPDEVKFGKILDAIFESVNYSIF